VARGRCCRPFANVTVNAFTNLKKRGVSLPKDVKDLVEIIDSAKTTTSKRTLRGVTALILSLMLKSRERHGTELLIDSEPEPEADSNVSEKIEGSWHHVMTLPADFRTGLIADLVRMAAFTGKEFPGVGLIGLKHKGKRLLWRIDMEAPGSQCVLTAIPEG